MPPSYVKILFCYISADMKKTGTLACRSKNLFLGGFPPGELVKPCQNILLLNIY